MGVKKTFPKLSLSPAVGIKFLQNSKISVAGGDVSPMYRTRRGADSDEVDIDTDAVVPVVRRMRSRTLPIQMLAQPPMRNYEGWCDFNHILILKCRTPLTSSELQ